MMYFRALTQGLNDLPEADACLRADLDEQKQMYGLDFLYRTLQQVDPETACRLKPNDSQRIERALEVYYLTGKPMSAHLGSPTSHTLPFDLHTAALIPENRARLHENIALRFRQMLEQGFIGEVENLRRRYPGLTADSPAIRCVGYRQTWEHLDGATDRQTFIEKGIAATRQLAKRQLTWLRKTPLDCVADPFSDGTSCTRLIEAAKRFFGA
ncbi:tRNA delta(2)-isopentenylpyrophosphate transferase [Neisseria meningitidis]|nr:tRNA delta(2)-isopentenylpyrophosphate transferase [Neisseria meningitidis]